MCAANALLSSGSLGASAEAGANMCWQVGVRRERNVDAERLSKASIKATAVL